MNYFRNLKKEKNKKKNEKKEREKLDFEKILTQNVLGLYLIQKDGFQKCKKKYRAKNKPAHQGAIEETKK